MRRFTSENIKNRLRTGGAGSSDYLEVRKTNVSLSQIPSLPTQCKILRTFALSPEGLVRTWWERGCFRHVESESGVSLISNRFKITELFDWLFFRACRKFASYSRKTIDNLQFAVQIELVPRKNIALPPPTLGFVAQTHMHENSVSGRGFGSRRYLHRKYFDVRGSPPKIM